MTVAKRIVFSGRVQGVGFRYTTHGLAQHFAVSGYVRNLTSGDVELVAEGDGDEVDRFLTAVEQQMDRYITSKTVDPQTPGNYQGFTIRA